ncbi:hypothetical protein WJX74_006720 [Apatococcus lobatus]|uniref:Uncharacterized protein n=1 Tax=Apatococcus lobatus TaxID=904363 RepID=A0AAW1QDJ7_9CHLO
MTVSSSPLSMLRQPSYKRHRTQAPIANIASAGTESDHLGPINDAHQGPKWVASLRTGLPLSQAAEAADGWAGSGYAMPILQHNATQQLPGKLAGGTGMQEGYAHRAWESRQWAIDSQALWGSAHDFGTPSSMSRGFPPLSTGRRCEACSPKLRRASPGKQAARGVSRAWAQQPTWKARMSMSRLLSALERDTSPLRPPISSGYQPTSSHSRPRAWWREWGWSYWRREAWLRAKRASKALGPRHSKGRSLRSKAASFRVPSNPHQQRHVKVKPETVPYKAYGILLGAAQDGLITDVQQLKVALQRELQWRVCLPAAEWPQAQPALSRRRTKIQSTSAVRVNGVQQQDQLATHGTQLASTGQGSCRKEQRQPFGKLGPDVVPKIQSMKNPAADARRVQPELAASTPDRRKTATARPRKPTSHVHEDRPKTAYEILLDQQHSHSSRHSAANIHLPAHDTPGQTVANSLATQQMHVRTPADSPGRSTRQHAAANHTSFALEMSELLQIQHHEPSISISQTAANASEPAPQARPATAAGGGLKVPTGQLSAHQQQQLQQQQQQHAVGAYSGAEPHRHQQAGLHGVPQRVLGQQQSSRNPSRFKPPNENHATANRRAPTGSPTPAPTPALLQTAHTALAEAAETAEKAARKLVHAARTTHLRSPQPKSQGAHVIHLKGHQHGSPAQSTPHDRHAAAFQSTAAHPLDGAMQAGPPGWGHTGIVKQRRMGELKMERDPASTAAPVQSRFAIPSGLDKRQPEMTTIIGNPAAAAQNQPHQTRPAPPSSISHGVQQHHPATGTAALRPHDQINPGLTPGRIRMRHGGSHDLSQMGHGAIQGQAHSHKREKWSPPAGLQLPPRSALHAGSGTRTSMSFAEWEASMGGGPEQPPTADASAPHETPAAVAEAAGPAAPSHGNEHRAEAAAGTQHAEADGASPQETSARQQGTGSEPDVHTAMASPVPEQPSAAGVPQPTAGQRGTDGQLAGAPSSPSPHARPDVGQVSNLEGAAAAAGQAPSATTSHRRWVRMSQAAGTEAAVEAAGFSAAAVGQHDGSRSTAPEAEAWGATTAPGDHEQALCDVARPSKAGGLAADRPSERSLEATASNEGQQKLHAPTNSVLESAMDSHRASQASISSATWQTQPSPPPTQQSQPHVLHHANRQAAARQQAQQEGSSPPDASSGNSYLDAIVQGTGMVRLPSLTPSHRARFSSDMTQGPSSTHPNAQDLQASRSLGGPNALSSQPSPAQGLKSAMKGSRLQATSSLAQHDPAHDTDLPTRQSSHASVSSAATSEVLARTVEHMEFTGGAKQFPNPSGLPPFPALLPGKSNPRGAGSMLQRMASHLGFSPTATSRPALPERTLHSELSLRDRYGTISASVSQVSSIGRLPSFSPCQAGPTGGNGVDEADEEVVTLSRIPSISMMPSVRTSLESVSMAEDGTRQAATAQSGAAGFVVRPAPASTLRAGRVPSMGHGSMSSQGFLAALKPVSSITTNPNNKQRDPKVQKGRLFRGATLGNIITRVGIASKRASKEQISQKKQSLHGTSFSRSSQEYKSRSPTIEHGPGSKRASQEQLGKALGRGNPKRPQPVPGTISRTVTTGALHTLPSGAGRHEPPLDTTEVTSGRGGRATGQKNDAAQPTTAGAGSRKLPRIFSLKHDFWTLRNAAPKAAAR